MEMFPVPQTSMSSYSILFYFILILFLFYFVEFMKTDGNPVSSPTKDCVFLPGYLH